MWSIKFVVFKQNFHYLQLKDAQKMITKIICTEHVLSITYGDYFTNPNKVGDFAKMKARPRIWDCL